MTIPGIKVLDEIIAGLPTNSAQRIEIGKLKEQIAALEEENQYLKNLVPSSDLAPETIEVLRIFFERDTPLTPREVARIRKLDVSIAKYHCDILLEREFLWLGNTSEPDEPYPYVITREGRAYIVERAMR